MHFIEIFSYDGIVFRQIVYYNALLLFKEADLAS